MRHSLLLRLLGLSLAVAICSIAATAWLTTRNTSERLKDEFVSTLEADSYVHGELLNFAQQHDSWDGVGPTVTRLAEAIGRPVGLASPTGEPLAESAVSPGQSGVDLSTNPVARIDPRSMGLEWIVRSSGWRLTEDEAAYRDELAAEATTCLADYHPDKDITVDRYGVVSATEESGKPPGVNSVIVELESDLASQCVSPELYEPSRASVEVHQSVEMLTAECAEAIGVDSDLAPTWTSATPTTEDVTPTATATATDVPTATPGPGDELVVTDCAVDAGLTAIGPFVAEPALLYIGSADRFDPFSDGGWQRTGLTGLAVLTMSGGLTVLAGRRLTRPIRALTVAAQTVGAGDRGARVPVSGHDEVAKLGQAFNSMANSLEAGERQRRAMVTDIAHELRTPLANIRGYLEAAEDGVVPLNAALVTSLLEESGQLHHLIDDLQDLALADAGKLRMHREETDAADLVRQVVAAHQASAATAELTLTAESLESVAVDVDPKRIRQALDNLVANAVRYTPAGGEITVSVRRSGDSGDSGDSGGTAVLTVTDNGPGIAPEHLPHVFDRFYRAEKSRSRATGGSGLGLAITRQLVEANDGTVEASSELGVGSVFTIRLPVSG